MLQVQSFIASFVGGDGVVLLQARSLIPIRPALLSCAPSGCVICRSGERYDAVLSPRPRLVLSASHAALDGELRRPRGAML